jgi:hypothetical protein
MCGFWGYCNVHSILHASEGAETKPIVKKRFFPIYIKNVRIPDFSSGILKLNSGLLCSSGFGKVPSPRTNEGKFSFLKKYFGIIPELSLSNSDSCTNGCTVRCIFRVRYGRVWYGMVWYCMVWYGMVWYGMEQWCLPLVYCTVATLPSTGGLFMVRSTLVLVRIWLCVLRVVCDDIAWCVRDGNARFSSLCNDVLRVLCIVCKVRCSHCVW